MSRSGNVDSFKNMTKRCNNVGVRYFINIHLVWNFSNLLLCRIYVDAVINHMSAGNGFGTAGNIANATNKYFPGVPYGPNDFHSDCTITNFNNKENSRNCELVGLKDLNQVI